jgi:hypothetical protein
MSLTPRFYSIFKILGLYCLLLMLIILAVLGMATKVFVLYIILPVFIFFTAFTIAVRERDRNFRVRELLKGVFKLNLWK